MVQTFYRPSLRNLQQNSNGFFYELIINSCCRLNKLLAAILKNHSHKMPEIIDLIVAISSQNKLKKSNTVISKKASFSLNFKSSVFKIVVANQNQFGNRKLIKSTCIIR
jgi:hypothetical protein